MHTAESAIDGLVDDFSFLDDWEDRYRYVIELGKELPALPDSERTDTNKVRGCASQVWLVSELRRNGDARLRFRGDSDAHIVRGLIAILFALYSGRSPREKLGKERKSKSGKTKSHKGKSHKGKSGKSKKGKSWKP